MKRLAAPAFWPVEKKTRKFVFRPTPGPHSSGRCMPLGVVIRDVLKVARNQKEIRQILSEGRVAVDGVVRKDKGFPVGMMDVLSVGEETYRMVPGRRGLELRKISRNEAGTKLFRIEDKRSVRKGKTQLNLHDGRNMIYDKHASAWDVLVYDIGQKAVKHVIKYDVGSTAMVTAGKNAGQTGRIEKIITVKSSMPNYVVVKFGHRKIALPEDYIFVVGADEPVITIGDGKK